MGEEDELQEIHVRILIDSMQGKVAALRETISRHNIREIN